MTLQHRLATLEAAILRPPMSMLTDAELQRRTDGYLVRMAAGADQEPLRRCSRHPIARTPPGGSQQRSGRP